MLKNLGQEARELQAGLARADRDAVNARQRLKVEARRRTEAEEQAEVRSRTTLNIEYC